MSDSGDYTINVFLFCLVNYFLFAVILQLWRDILYYGELLRMIWYDLSSSIYVSCLMMNKSDFQCIYFTITLLIGLRIIFTQVCMEDHICPEVFSCSYLPLKYAWGSYLPFTIKIILIFKYDPLYILQGQI